MIPDLPRALPSRVSSHNVNSLSHQSLPLLFYLFPDQTVWRLFNFFHVYICLHIWIVMVCLHNIFNILRPATKICDQWQFVCSPKAIFAFKWRIPWRSYQSSPIVSIFQRKSVFVSINEFKLTMNYPNLKIHLEIWHLGNKIKADLLWSFAI